MRALMPLSDFEPEDRARIEELVAQDTPPKKWLRGELSAIPSRAWVERHLHRGRDPFRSRRPIPQWMRRRVIARDGHVCQLCGSEVEPHDIHLDHIRPLFHSGQDTVDNLQVTHSRCNIRKGAKLL